MADNSQKIKDLEDIQDTGASSAAVDGVSVSFDLDAVQKRKRELQQTDNAQKTKRPRLASIDLRNAF